MHIAMLIYATIIFIDKWVSKLFLFDYNKIGDNLGGSYIQSTNSMLTEHFILIFPLKCNETIKKCNKKPLSQRYLVLLPWTWKGEDPTQWLSSDACDYIPLFFLIFKIMYKYNLIDEWGKRFILNNIVTIHTVICVIC